MFNRLITCLIVIALLPIIAYALKFIYENGIYFGIFLRKILLFLYFS